MDVCITLYVRKSNAVVILSLQFSLLVKFIMMVVLGLQRNVQHMLISV